MLGSQQLVKAGSCCTLCPAGCELRQVKVGPDSWRIEPAETGSAGLCPRGSTLGELLAHRKRIFWPAKRQEGRLRQVGMDAALAALIEAAGDRGIIVFFDANLPCEQLARADACCRAWRGARLCLVMEPADRQMLLGAEASGADYLADDALADCDGFVVIGDAFAANPRCSRAVFERRAREPRTPIVAIDAACGTAAKFATHVVQVGAGMEFQALAAVAAAAGVDVELPGATPAGEMPSAQAAGQAVARCERLGVLLAAEYGRSAAWRQIGYLAGRLATARGGGLACQTVGANVLAALRCSANFETINLADALADTSSVRVAVGCDVVGMLGGAGGEFLAAAAALPNQTTAAAEIVLPLALPVEVGGTVLFSGMQEAEVEPVVAPPAGVPTPAELIGRMAPAAGPSPPGSPSAVCLERLAAEVPGDAASSGPAAAPVLLFARQAAHAGSGALTGHGSWQQAARGPLDLRVSAADAEAMGVSNLAPARVAAEGRSVPVRIRVCQELADGIVVLPGGMPEARALAPCRIDSATRQVVASPVTAAIET